MGFSESGTQLGEIFTQVVYYCYLVYAIMFVTYAFFKLGFMLALYCKFRAEGGVKDQVKEQEKLEKDAQAKIEE